MTLPFRDVWMNRFGHTSQKKESRVFETRLFYWLIILQFEKTSSKKPPLSRGPFLSYKLSSGKPDGRFARKEAECSLRSHSAITND